MPSRPGWSFIGKLRNRNGPNDSSGPNDSNDPTDSNDPNDSAAGRDEVRTVFSRGEPGRELESECGDPADTASVDLFPVVARTVIVGVETGEEVDRRHPPGDERGIVAAPGARALAAHPQLIPAGGT